MAGTLISLPAYVPDPTSLEYVTGYDVQSCSSAFGFPVFTGTWTTITGSPFSTPNNIVDPNGLYSTWYRARPIRTVPTQSGPIVLDTPFSDPFQGSTLLYDATITRFILPAMRFTYLNDAGIAQSNGTNVAENTGSGNGLWAPDGTLTRFPLQYVDNDDPVRVLDGSYTLTKFTGGEQGTQVPMVPNQDYYVDLKNGVVLFATPPGSTDYLRFDFYRAMFVNNDLMSSLAASVDALSQFGINGYQFHQENNLRYMVKQPDTDLIQIICKIALHLMRQGHTDSALRSSTTWRDGGESVDPYPSRALQFLVEQGVETESSLQKRANAYIRSHTLPVVRGDFDIMFDLTQFAPMGQYAFGQLGAFSQVGSGIAAPYFPWWASH